MCGEVGGPRRPVENYYRNNYDSRERVTFRRFCRRCSNKSPNVVESKIKKLRGSNVERSSHASVVPARSAARPSPRKTIFDDVPRPEYLLELLPPSRQY